MTWSTFDLKPDGQTEWLVLLYEKAIRGLRKYGLPSENDGAVLKIKIPTMQSQAEIMRYREPSPPGRNIPSGVVEFLLGK